MRVLVEGITEVIYAMRLTTAEQWVLRVLTLLSLTGAALLCLWWFPNLIQVVLLAAIAVTALWTVAQPESWAPLAGIGTVVLWWLSSAAGAQWWQTAAVAVLLAVFHLCAAVCAAAPSYASVRRPAVLAVLTLALAQLGISAAGIALVYGIAAVPADVVPRGIVWVGLALGAVAAAAVLTRVRAHRR